MSFYFGDAKSEMRKNDAFDPAREIEKVPGKGI
jgi:hypothetical protein